MRERTVVTKRPNILLLVADDHRYDGIAAYGNPNVRTPALDRLASEGVRYESVYTMGGLTAALCVPGRACLLTGANAFHATASASDVPLGDTENPDLWELNPTLAALPDAFRQAGYRTHGIGKWHNGKSSFTAGFSGGSRIFFGGMGDHGRLPLHDYDPSGAYPDDAARPGGGFSSELFADAAIEFIRGYRESEPFLLYVAFTAPHDPRTPPERYARLYEADALPLPANFRTEHPFDNGELDVRDERLASLPRAPDEIRRHLADYYGLITHLDAQVDRILRALQDSGRTSETIVVYTADHGIALGQHGLLGKQNLYEHSIRIPLLMRGPGLPRGETAAGLGCQMDIFPTLCELTGTPIPATVEGGSLLPLASGAERTGRATVFAAYKRYQRMASDGRWKLIRYYRAGDRGTDFDQLFDLAADPWETRNLAEEPECAGHLTRLGDELRDWQLCVRDPLLQSESDRYY